MVMFGIGRQHQISAALPKSSYAERGMGLAFCEVASSTRLSRCLAPVHNLWLVQEYAVRQPGVMPRPAFERVAKECSCQLHFPFPDEELVLLKSGLLQHLRKYMQVLSAAQSPFNRHGCLCI